MNSVWLQLIYDRKGGRGTSLLIIMAAEDKGTPSPHPHHTWCQRTTSWLLLVDGTMMPVQDTLDIRYQGDDYDYYKRM
jgi:hypothetical protein